MNVKGSFFYFLRMSEAVATTPKAVKSKSKVGATAVATVVADGGVKKASRTRKRVSDSLRGYLRVLARERLHANRTLRSSGLVALEDVAGVIGSRMVDVALECRDTLSPDTETLTEAHVTAMLGILWPNVVDPFGQKGSSGSTIYGDQINVECVIAVRKFKESLAAD